MSGVEFTSEQLQEGIATAIAAHDFQAAIDMLTAYHWPGNVRELENVLERAVALEATPAILPESLPASVRGASAARARVT